MEQSAKAEDDKNEIDEKASTKNSLKKDEIAAAEDKKK